MVCLYLWGCVAALSPVIVLFRSHMAALQHPTQSSISLPLLRCPAVALLHNVQLWSVVVWWETSAPLLLQNPLITWFCLCIAFFISRHCEKKSSETHKLCPNDNRGNTITGNTFTTNPALSPQWLVLHANQDGRMSLLYSLCDQQLQQNLGIFIASSSSLSFSHCLHWGCHVSECKQYLEPPRSQDWKAPAPFDL